jgi:hypothetical protein
MKWWRTFALLVPLALVAGCAGLPRQQPVPCLAAQPSGTVTAAVPDWQVAPNMLLWENKPTDQPYPMAHLTYELTLTNQGTKRATAVHAYLGSELFGWQEMAFDYGKNEPDKTCPVLEVGQSNRWTWGKHWLQRLDPAWRTSMENTTEVKLVWEDDTGWHEFRAKLPSQYAPNVYKAQDLK